PTLVIHGTEDQVVPPRFGSFIAERIPGAGFHWLEGVGHRAFVEAPSQFKAVVLSFLDEVETKGGGQGGPGPAAARPPAVSGSFCTGKWRSLPGAPGASAGHRPLAGRG